MNSELAKKIPEGFNPQIPNAKRVMEYRDSNRENFINAPLPTAKRALVIGAGPSVTADLLISMDEDANYDAILVCYTMAEHFRMAIIRWPSQFYIVDGEFINTTTPFYEDLICHTHLICPWEKPLKPEWEFRAVTFLMPEGEPNWEKRARLSPNYPKSIGAIALQVALEDMGGETIVDVIGIDCTGDSEMFKEETLRVIDRHRDRVNLINCKIYEE